ncbi:superfamily I DNA and/or RNA helicase [Serratia fonticola]|uniref:Superfamily I DNA and/or RNA helicase n=1 Tax=Serratia fonticola TaxID=47917 RepID=A0A542BJ38_SERFO|nr:AAA domain-containing protein [Serratia fonticola]TQI78583.1 superfamily I DNA and/or RNA helicase [Serratia fonticola]TQI99394.1 superfamily I DNA and/or RNA helicase [Serratia fonticola]TVZ68919.1 superfamily I DNA and/or RNA helicase [Serratia fonticola]
MDSNTQGFTSYWRNTLADAESGKGAFERKDEDSFTQWMNIEQGRLGEEIVQSFFEGEDQQVKTVEVLLRPQVWIRLLKHGKERTAGAPGIVTPLVTFALLNREGFLFPTSPATIPRDLLEPLPKGTFSIGEMAEYDKYKTTHDSITFGPGDEDELREETDEQRAERHARYQQLWQKYLKDTDELLKHVAGQWLASPEQYEPAGYGYVIKAKQPGGASIHILPMYDHLLSCKKEVPLLARFASKEKSPVEPLLANNAMFSERLGHSGDKFPLAVAQRDALSHYLTQQPGDILAVNGPPGTGKTTLVLSIIATEWARAALNKTEPPVVIATSTNNQAVTNIIEAFGKDFSIGAGPMAGRWLPDVKSFGAYFPSSGRRAEAVKKYQTEDFFNRVESLEYVEEAQFFFIEKARAAFPAEECCSPEHVVDLLHQRLVELSEQLEQIKPVLDRLNVIRQERRAISDDLEQYIQDKRALLLNSTNEISLLTQGKKQWQQYRAGESIMFALFSWLPVVRTKRHYQMNLFLEATFGARMAAFQDSLPDGIDAFIDVLIAQALKDQAELQQQIDHAEDVSQRENEAAICWREITHSLGYAGEAELSLSEVDELADTQLRFPAFLLATHYWEGRWLMDMAAIDNLQKEKGLRGAKAVKARWLRRMKLTPCVVMTCFMLPHHMLIREHVGGKKFDDGYFYNFADLLIVDEAGQVLPEVAASSFALAKKALVIGDTEQIAPIWNSLPGIDIGNMVEENILPGGTQEELTEAYALVCDSGKSAASGSVMKVAQFNSRYQYDPDLARGMYLYEHRRCFDNIIGYCNHLCYHGKLQPKRGEEKGTIFPAMGYLHIDGKGVQANGGSRYNAFEAETIAAWLSAHKEDIESHYGKPLHELVGVVTPFSAQVSTIKSSLRKLDISCNSDENSLTVGTVHSLQGAERAIVLFSPVYSKHEDGGFIDSDSSMLNVAVSRAKDSFLVFGDMDLFEIQPGSSPRGLLAKYLFASDSNALQFEYKERQDLNTVQTQVSTLHGVEQHDAFLNQTFDAIGKSITIVSPWLTWQKLEQTGFLASMTKARSRGIDITVVTDKGFNTEHADYEKRKEKQQRLNDAVEKLSEMGITTKLVNRVHSKIVIGDEGLLCIGSFNWFSAAREKRYQRYDTSMVYRGELLTGEIRTIYASLEQRQL